MKKAYAILAIMLAMLLVTPSFGFWHPGVPTCDSGVAVFGVTINGEITAGVDPYIYNFTEPNDNYCDNVTVEVWIFNVTDFYGYEFEIWWDQTYFELIDWAVEATWPSQFQVLPAADYDGSEPYEQVVTAMAPSTGVTGDFKLATLTFHIINDVCYLQAPGITGLFQLWNVKASDSCSKPIKLCNPLDGYWRFKPKKPKVYIDPPEEVNSKVGDMFTVTVWVENVVKLHDIHFELYWHGYQFQDEPGVWTALLCTTEDDVVINDEVFPELNFTISYTVNSPDCDTRYGADPIGSVILDIVRIPPYPLLNGTFWVMKITFEKCDPWYCGAQPEYTRKGDHDWDCENATTPIEIHGWFSVYCPDYAYMYLWQTVSVKNGKFVFDPIPGDLDGSGHVDITDILIIAGYYGYELIEPWPGLPPKYITFYYDLDNDKDIDIFDIVIVAKNFCRTAP